ncbi:MAG: hypothetical protein V2B18_16495, partial [Pseudomonadota bacterium]
AYALRVRYHLLNGRNIPLDRGSQYGRMVQKIRNETTEEPKMRNAAQEIEETIYDWEVPMSEKEEAELWEDVQALILADGPAEEE